MAAEEAMKALQEEAANSADDQVGTVLLKLQAIFLHHGQIRLSLSPSEFSDILLVPL